MRSATVVAVLSLALLAACDKPQPAAEIRPVRTVTAIAGSDGEPVSLTGHVRAQILLDQGRPSLVESRCGAVAVGRTYLLPPLSSGGALVVRP